MAKTKRLSRALRWATAATEANAALDVLVELQEEFQAWRDNLPENLENSALCEKLDAVCDLDLTGAAETLSDAEGLELPLGFGRD